MRIEEKKTELCFGDFDEKNCFHIEKSIIYNKLQNNRKVVEFILNKPEHNKLYFIEATKTLANETNSHDYNTNMREKAQKFIDSFHLALSIWFEIHEDKNELPTNYDNFFAKKKEYWFVLVIKNRPKNSLPNIKEMLVSKLIKDIKIWDFKVLVLNEELAKKYKIVIND